MAQTEGAVYEQVREFLELSGGHAARLSVLHPSSG
jgi:hypothetical protein